MGTFEIILLAGVALSVLQLSAGVAIGLWFGRRRQADATADRQRAQQIAAELDTITSRVDNSLQDHAERVAAADKRLRDEQPTAGQPAGPLTDLVVGVVGELLTANQQMVFDLEQTRSELSQKMDELNEHRRQAHTDSLTGLPNRRAFDDRIRDMIDGWRKRQAPFTLLMIDIDRFKQFNDTHGHQTGDEALRTVAAALREALRNHDVVARYGGEEFAVLLPFATLANVRPAVEKLLQNVASVTIGTPTGETGATISIGAAQVLPQERTEALIERADSALYAAKQNGRNQAWQHAGDDQRLLASGPSELAAEPVAETTEHESGVQQACSELSASLADFMSQPGADAPEPRATAGEQD